MYVTDIPPHIDARSAYPHGGEMMSSYIDLGGSGGASVPLAEAMKDRRQ